MLVEKINQLKSKFSFNQHSNYTTHITGGVLQWSFYFVITNLIVFSRYNCKHIKVNGKYNKLM